MGGVADDLLYRPELPSPEVVTAALSKSMAKKLASSSSNSSLGSLEEEFGKDEPSKLMLGAQLQCFAVGLRGPQTYWAVKKITPNWYEAKKADIEEGVPRLTIPDLPKRVMRNADGVTKKYAATSHLNRLLKTQYVAEVMKDFIPPARRAKERRRAPAERCLEKVAAKTEIEERVSSTLTHEAARDLDAWADNRSKFLAKKAQQLERRPRNDFAKLYTQEDRDRAAVLIQRFWKGRIRSWRLQAAMNGMRARRLDAQKLAREREARETDEKEARDRSRRSKLTARIFAGGHPNEAPDNIRAKLVHWIRSAARCGPSVMHAREVEMITMIEDGLASPDDYGYALEVGCREGHRDGIIFLLSTPGIPELVRPFMVKCTAVAAMASNERCFELMLDQLTQPELAEFAFSHPDYYRSVSPSRRPSVPMASRSRRTSVSSHQERRQAGEHAKLVRFVRRKVGNVVRAWRLYFDPRCRNGQINFDNFVEACKEAGFIGDYSRAFLEAQGIEGSADHGRIHPTGCITFQVLLDNDSEGTTLRPSEGLIIFRGALSNTTRTSARAKESEQTEKWIRLFETTAAGRRISRDHFKQARLAWWRPSHSCLVRYVRSGG
ncbi:hypothetical protein FOL47_007323 [Perkinsus chesapeaki]|uniref:Uncharacterized protein n=1 Tax=Perkinsus chesapeaki TaxID=330153 RepID=A0A7J6MVT2_PERCH|nr:hypothetical protein FOL47_007323 [Perkinsus chesapeaki]